MSRIKLIEVNNQNDDFKSLCRELDEYLNVAAGGEGNREEYKKHNNSDTMDYVIVAYEDEDPIGCAALRRYSKTEIEVKRVFVKKAYRGRNVGGKLMEELILEAKNLGYSRMILETGAFLDAAERLYSKCGFRKIENYGAYINMQESLCMELNIEAGK